jgi:two-component system osmolarity sensor histidine kinase EnvZ
MPTSLFARALLILLVPVVVLQLLVAHIFYDRHWNSVVRSMSMTTAADVAMLTREYQALSVKLGTKQALAETVNRGKLLSIEVRFRSDPQLIVAEGGGREKFPDFYDMLNETIDEPLMILPSDEDTIRIRVNATGGVLEFTFSSKRLASSTTLIFILWMVGSAVLLTTIAILFLRNQVRPIVQLARAAEQFGLGQEVDNFSPRGANEVRRAGRAFLMMAERTRRHVQNRTEMLASISHDLRTPLTRMTLELEMGKVDTPTRAALTGEIEEMRHMIDEYLDFARGDAGEIAEPIDLAALVTDVVKQYQRGKQKVVLGAVTPAVLMVRPQALRRALTNIIDNALRYGGGKAEVALEQSLTFMRIKVTDQGTGIPEIEQEAVFKPFTRLEPSRNLATGGVGLGLSIARAVAQSHGGEVTLLNLRDDDGKVLGLEVTLRLPREMQNLSA